VKYNAEKGLSTC